MMYSTPVYIYVNLVQLYLVLPGTRYDDTG